MNPVNTPLPIHPSMGSSGHSPPNPNPNPNPMQEQQALPKKRRNLPGTPDPEAEVVALSPESLMAKNRYVCEACGKGFQREQNLQLHRRGHNLPWKLRQKGVGKEARRKVYVCPVEACVHHEASRALGDLTGIKKHYSRKHGEKRWKCERCSKKYAVQSDWKAHCRTCGTRQYTCDCGTVFSRKDSFVTHRAFCDALIQETARLSSVDTDRHFRLDHAAPNNGFHQPRGNIGDHDHQLGPMQLPNSHLILPPQTLTTADNAMHMYSNDTSSPSTSALSATALLQKAARMGVVGSCTSSSMFAGFAGSNMVAAVQPRSEQLGRDYWNEGGTELTRDFLGVGAVDEECFRQPFASPELAGMCSSLDVLGPSMFKTCN